MRFTSFFRGTIRNERTYKYKKKLLTKEVLYDYENPELRKRENTLYFYEYNKDKKLIKRTIHSVAEHLEKEQIDIDTYEYNQYDQLSREIREHDGDLKSKTTYNYEYW